ncbi:MAG: cation-transporting P-type ATPase, partial [Bacteroidetes bacterium]|nr:cation-transporting P-type ATPase [Bacteroidota bacterium]
MTNLKSFWQYPPEEIAGALKSTANGLTQAEAIQRLALTNHKKHERPLILQDAILFLSQFKSPLILLLVAAVILSAFLGETSDVAIILFILLATGITGYIQERHAGQAVEKLKSIIKTKIRVLRDGSEHEVFAEEVVPGDVLLFSAGDIIPADCLLFEVTDLHANEAALTGETFPAEK